MFPGEFLPWLHVQLQQIDSGAALITGTCVAGPRAGPAQSLTRRIRRSDFPGAPTHGCRLPGSARRWSPSSLLTLDRDWDSGNSPLESGERKGQTQHSCLLRRGLSASSASRRSTVPGASSCFGWVGISFLKWKSKTGMRPGHLTNPLLCFQTQL